MNNDYADIIEKVGEPPKWWDENAVPRFCEFHPKHCSNIYAREAALVLIACQSCGTRYKVAFSADQMQQVVLLRQDLSQRIIRKHLYYGDPPNTKCCPAGATMNSDPISVLEYWRRSSETHHQWVRNPELEVSLDDGNDLVAWKHSA